MISPLARPCRFTERSGNRKFELWVGSHLGAERHMIVRSRARRVRSQAKWLSAVTRTSNLSALAPVCASAMFRRRGLRVLAR